MVPLPPHLVPPVDPPKVHGDAGDDEHDDDQRLQRLREDGAAEQEEADAAEDDGRGDPGLVRALEVGFADAQDDEAEDGEEVEGVAGDAVEGDEGAELADDAVSGCEDGVEDEGVDGGEEEAGILISEHGVELLCEPASGALRRKPMVFVADANAAKELREVAFLAGNVDETAGCESRGVEGAETAGADDQGEDQGSDGAKDLGSEHDGDSVGAVDAVEG